jgi:hypothetical protein
MKKNENSNKFILLVKISGALCSCLLPESLQVTSVKQLPEYHECSGVYISCFMFFRSEYSSRCIHVFHLVHICNLLCHLLVTVYRRWICRLSLNCHTTRITRNRQRARKTSSVTISSCRGCYFRQRSPHKLNVICLRWEPLNYCRLSLVEYLSIWFGVILFKKIIKFFHGFLHCIWLIHCICNGRIQTISSVVFYNILKFFNVKL